MSSAPRPPDPTPSPELVEAAAAAWLSLRDRGLSAAETAEFVRWFQQDPQHAAVFAQLDRAWKSFDRLGAVPVAESAVSAPDADLLAPRVRPYRHVSLKWTGFSVAAAAVILLLTVVHFRDARHSVETAVGAFQKLDLPDGSVAQLNTDTAIETDFSATARRVRVVRGEVFFAVVRDPARPFIVTAGPVAVRAVGTAFNVRQRESAIEVLVTEGSVRVEDLVEGKPLLISSASSVVTPVLFAGERAMIPIPSLTSDVTAGLVTVDRISSPEVHRALAWQERRLEFDAVPLADIVQEFNRYNRLQLVIGDPSLGLKRFSGTFRADGYESLLRLLEVDFGVTVSRGEGRIILRAGR